MRPTPAPVPGAVATLPRRRLPRVAADPARGSGLRDFVAGYFMLAGASQGVLLVVGAAILLADGTRPSLPVVLLRAAVAVALFRVGHLVNDGRRRGWWLALALTGLPPMLAALAGQGSADSIVVGVLGLVALWTIRRQFTD